MREIRPSGSAGGAGQLNAPFLPRSGGRGEIRLFGRAGARSGHSAAAGGSETKKVHSRDSPLKKPSFRA